MALPPEQINIKRRREEEPVDTLYIQSELHQTKRRFTDFVFQRVTVSSSGISGRATDDDRSDSPISSSFSAARRVVRSPRAVSSIHVPKTTNTGGVPSVRATSPGAEFREEKRVAAARKEAKEKLKNALHSSSPTLPKSDVQTVLVPATNSDETTAGDSGPVSSTTSGRGSPVSGSSGRASRVRRFQISRPSAPMSPLRSTRGGVQKRRGAGAVAVLVEKLRREPHSRQASMVAGVTAVKAQGSSLSSTSRDSSVAPESTPALPRKRPVVNQAEKKWREERQMAISAAKEHITQVLEKGAQARQSNWEDESERLARELEKVALEMDGEIGMQPPEEKQYEPSAPTRTVVPKPPLKYPPRTPNKHRAAAAAGITQGEPIKPVTTEHDSASESDGEYVYDTYIRRPLPDTGFLTDPLADLELDQETWLRQHGIDATRQDVGVIVITPEDEVYWEDFAEDDEDEDRWDSEDGDSNAENNPANDYPDEELSWDDEEDDPTAIYRKYRSNGRSDDEEYDWDDSDSEGAGTGRFGNRFGAQVHVESDEEGW